MLPAETLGLFFVASVALGLAPGPDNLFVLTQSALHGRVAGLLVTLGLCTGLLVHTAAVALGVAAIFKTSPLAFTLLKAAGAAYLLYLAWMTLRAPPMPLDGSGPPALGARQLYARGIVMNVTNPKVTIFFLAFLPQFTDPARGSPTLQVLLLGAVFMLSTLLVFGSIAWAAGFIGERLRRSARAQLAMNRIAALVFAALALRLALSPA
ncbi:LysE family translocator [uncultured Piscinibacter sp.]|uniref:LysE family translocator n=1 Tax=uncultured Piscinibacter sp. TaxID=1131835 RepID=UPI002602B838|nr:LysE family translocator [uncultured Piscinibacter sp.]